MYRFSMSHGLEKKKQRMFMTQSYMIVLQQNHEGVLSHTQQNVCVPDLLFAKIDHGKRVPESLLAM